MDSDMILSWYTYGEWANERLLAMAESLDDAQLRRTFSPGYRALLDTFAHLASVDWGWYARCSNWPLSGLDVLKGLTSLAGVRHAWADLIPRRHGFIRRLSDEQLRQPVPSKRRRDDPDLLMWQGLFQCVNHGTQHRSEIAAMLTELGRAPGDLDYVVYLATLKTP